MKLTKEQFIKKVNTYQRMCEEEHEIINALNCNPEWKPSSWLDEYYRLLSEMCELPENKLYGTDLDYYCYDLAFGKKWEPGMIKIDEKDIPCRNAEELWDLIMLEAE